MSDMFSRQLKLVFVYKLLLRSVFLTLKNLAKAFKFRPASASRMLLQFTVQNIYFKTLTSRLLESLKLPSANKSYGHFHMVISLSCRQKSQVNKVHEVLFIGRAIIENKTIHKRHIF